MSINNSSHNKSYWSWNLEKGSIILGSTFSSLFTPRNNDGSHLSRYFDAQYSDYLTSQLISEIENNEDGTFLCAVPHPSDDNLQVVWNGEILQQDNGNISQVAGEVWIKNGSDLSNQLLESEFFNQLLTSFPDSIFFKNKKSEFILINETCSDKFGLENSSQAVGKTDFDFFEDNHAQQAYNDEQRILETGDPILGKIEREEFKDAQRGIRWTSTSKFPLRDTNGNTIGIFGFTRDITDLVLAEKEAEKSQVMLKNLFEQSPGFLFIFKFSETSTYLEHVSPGIKDLVEIEPEDVSTSMEAFLERIEPDDRKHIIGTIRDAVSNLTLWECDFRVNLPNKGTRWLRGKATPKKVESGKITGYGYVIDITEEKEAYNKNVMLRKQLQNLLDTIPNFIFAKDFDGKYVFVNQALADFFGIRDKEVFIGKTNKELGISVDRDQSYLELDRFVIKNNEPLFIPDEKTQNKDGGTAWHQIIKVPFSRIESSELVALSIVIDITDRKEREIELHESLDIIGDQNKRLQNFAHIVSHNLRNHAGSISMLLEVFEIEESPEEKEIYLQHLKKASKQLIETISDLNEIIDEQYSSLKVEKEVNLREYFDKITQILTTEIKTHRVSIKEEIPASLYFKYNPAYLESILLNFMSNAIKYRHPDRRPHIHFKAWAEDEKIYISISDNGLGIDLEEYGDKLFGMYNTFHDNENSKGIGLFITKNQIETMGGAIEVESTPGEGTTFIVRLN